MFFKTTGVVMLVLISAVAHSNAGIFCPKVKLPNTNYDTQSMIGKNYSLIDLKAIGSIFLNADTIDMGINCPNLPLLVGGDGLIHLGGLVNLFNLGGGDVVISNGKGSTVDGLITATLFQTGDQKEIQVIYVCVSFVGSIIAVYRLDGSHTPAAAAIEYIKKYVNMKNWSHICKST